MTYGLCLVERWDTPKIFQRRTNAKENKKKIWRSSYSNPEQHRPGEKFLPEGCRHHPSCFGHYGISSHTLCRTLPFVAPWHQGRTSSTQSYMINPRARTALAAALVRGGASPSRRGLSAHAGSRLPVFIDGARIPFVMSGTTYQ